MTLTCVPSTTVVSGASKIAEYGDLTTSDGDQRLLAVLQDPFELTAVGTSLEERVDLFDRRGALALDREVDQRSCRHRNANREAMELPCERRHDETDRLRGSRGRRHEIGCGRACPPEVLVRAVEEHLIAGVRVHRRHDAVADADRLVQQLCNRSQAVRRAGRVRNDVVLLGVVGLEVDAECNRDVGFLRRSRDDHLSRSPFEVLRGVGATPEATRRLDDDIDVELLPRQLSRVAHRRSRDLHAVDDDASFDRLDRPVEASVDGVVREQVRQHRRVGDVVDRDPLDVRL